MRLRSTVFTQQWHPEQLTLSTAGRLCVEIRTSISNTVKPKTYIESERFGTKIKHSCTKTAVHEITRLPKPKTQIATNSIE